MKRAAGITASAFGVLLLAACSGPGGGPRGGMGPPLRPIAEPSRVVATEMSFARAAQEKGQWTAFAEFAAPEAVMFVPAPVKAKDWLKTQVNPRQAVRWQPHRIWSSCDGSLAVTQGAWQKPDGSFGRFTTIWERQQDSSYKWVLDYGEALKAPLPEPEMVQAEVADCHSTAPRLIIADGFARIAPYKWGKASADGTLTAEMYLNDGHRGELTFGPLLSEGMTIPSVAINAGPE